MNTREFGIMEMKAALKRTQSKHWRAICTRVTVAKRLECVRLSAAVLAILCLASLLRLSAAEVNSVVGTNLTTTNAPPSTPPAPLETPRDFFNAGTRKLQEK